MTNYRKYTKDVAQGITDFNDDTLLILDQHEPHGVALLLETKTGTYGVVVGLTFEVYNSLNWLLSQEHESLDDAYKAYKDMIEASMEGLSCMRPDEELEDPEDLAKVDPVDTFLDRARYGVCAAIGTFIGDQILEGHISREASFRDRLELALSFLEDLDPQDPESEKIFSHIRELNEDMGW